MDINPIEILLHYYNYGDDLFATTIIHGKKVAAKALEIVNKKRISVDPAFIYNASMLHDIGIFLTNAPGIHCNGTEPYIRHGELGGQLLMNMGLDDYARICERHTGAGISKEDIINNNLPLKHIDYLPITIEEKLICYADKFYSKSNFLVKEKPLDKIMQTMEKFGSDSLKRFKEMHEIFGK